MPRFTMETMLKTISTFRCEELWMVPRELHFYFHSHNSKSALPPLSPLLLKIPTNQ
jgi:hypothetical protein